MTDQPGPDPGEYTRGERIAGLVGFIFFALLAAMAFDMATGGRITSRIAGNGGNGEPA